MGMEQKKFKEQLVYAYWLHAAWAMTNRKLWEITEKIGMPKKIYECDREGLKNALSEKQIEKLENSKKKWNLQERWECLKEQSIRFLPFFHPDYPEKLRTIPDAPWAVYVKGILPKTSPSVAVIGARQCSEYGRMAAARIGKSLGENGIVAVSGMARGIDGISQLAALETGGRSLAVLGCGVDICYPRGNQRLYEMLEEQGGIVSEYPPGTQPVGALFPPRNRIISGLSDVLVVVEAKEKSGTTITVDMALEQGKEVLVLPGRITDALSYGCNRLIKQGAGILVSVEDIFQVLGTSEKMGNVRSGWKECMVPESGLDTEEERRIYEILDFMPKNLEQIWWEYGREQITMQQLMYRLLELCLKGKAVQAGGCYYKTGK